MKKMTKKGRAVAAPQVKQKRYDETEEIVENDTENIDWYVKDRLSTSWAKKGGWLSLIHI